VDGEATRPCLELQTERGRVEAMKQFVGETSHDLRTSISVITTSLYLLRKKLPPEQANLRQLDALEAQTQHMVHILENLGRLSDLDDGTTFNYGNVNLNTLVDRLVEQFQPLAQQHNLTLTADLAPAKIMIRADDVQMTRALQNLVNNAINYTLPDGQVTVMVRSENGCAVLEVRDTGIGIPPESLPHIFERFYRADAARPAYLGGMGLGLTITRRIVEMHRGDIEVESQPGRGSCFRIHLPLAENFKLLV
jgi:signal transduction histidine kinase